ncbi:MAG: hypothetical protein JRG86_04520 [Deltaproteobacteria bacterium]|jgi:hypothetical protein|nr:hypothetical protein [Deltaproteobacteria bacterium]MBW2496022.1 hypothetical protein [Deltaproteobacteria bacterium]
MCDRFKAVMRRLPLALTLSLALLAAGVVSAEPAQTPVLDAAAAPPAAMADPLEELFEVPGLWSSRTTAQATDEALAAAVAEGSRKDLERESGFRKRNTDLFRAEREVEIGDKEMRLRLRLRAKQREAVRVELKF